MATTIKPEIKTLDDFQAAFPDADWLESRRGFDGFMYERWTNGEGESTDHESEWFDMAGNLADPWN